MTKKEQIINQINDFENKYFNEDQKRIMIDIIQNAPAEKVQVYFDFLKYKRKNGFTFDYSPEIAMGRIIKLYEDKQRRINVDDEVMNDENKLIIGDNYNALKSLLVTHKNRINIIYIDPPYNTESAKTDGNQSSKEGIASKFIYKDKFGRGGWLNMMKQRLDLAKDLMTDDGVIFVSIDDQEQAYLKMLMDEIFGEENYVGEFIRKTKSTTNDAKTGFNNQHDIMFIYSKKIDNIKIRGDKKDFSNYKNPDNDPNGAWISDNPSARTGSYFEIKNPYTGKIDVPPENCQWRFSGGNFNNLVANGKIKFLKNHKENQRGFIFKRYKKEIKSIYHLIPSLYFVDNNYMNQVGTKELLKIFPGKRVFDYPKPIKLIKKIINLINNKTALILDFFAGSGTTGQAVMELNQEDGGKRQFILCTNNENHIAENITYERLHRVIKGEGTKGEKDFKWLQKNKHYANEKLRVIWIDDTIKINNDLQNGEKIENDILKGLKMLDPSYSHDNLNFYYDLAALNPLESE